MKRHLKKEVKDIRITIYEHNLQVMYHIAIGIPYNCKTMELLFSKDAKEIIMSKSKRQKIVCNWEYFDVKEDHGDFRRMIIPRKDISECWDYFPQKIKDILNEYFNI